MQLEMNKEQHDYILQCYLGVQVAVKTFRAGTPYTIKPLLLMENHTAVFGLIGPYQSSVAHIPDL